MAQAAVLEVGNCDPDHATLNRMLTQHFDVQVDRVMFVDEAIKKLESNQYALVLFNRLIFADSSPGIALLQQAKTNGINKTPMMMISNFDESQQQCIAAGGVPGFGKNAIFERSTLDLLGKYLPARN